MAEIKMNIINQNGNIGMDISAQKIYPPLEDLEVTPSGVEQVFTHPNSYGYDTVTVERVEADTLNITPTTESQEYTGLYGTVNVGAVDSSIDSDIQSSNIKDGITILGVSGELQSAESLIDRTLTKATVPVLARTIREYLFENCTKLEEIIIEDGITDIETYAFSNCTKLRRINFPDSIKTIGTHAFDRVPIAGYIKLPSSLTTLNGAFRYCTEVTAFDIPTGVTSIGSSTFTYCSSLDTIILRSNTLCALANTNAFTSTLFRTTGGTAYVPSALISQYENATNWSSLTVTFKAIEGSEYE